MVEIYVKASEVVCSLYVFGNHVFQIFFRVPCQEIYLSNKYSYICYLMYSVWAFYL